MYSVVAEIFFYRQIKKDVNDFDLKKYGTTPSWGALRDLESWNLKYHVLTCLIMRNISQGMFVWTKRSIQTISKNKITNFTFSDHTTTNARQNEYVSPKPHEPLLTKPRTSNVNCHHHHHHLIHQLLSRYY